MCRWSAVDMDTVALLDWLNSVMAYLIKVQNRKQLSSLITVSTLITIKLARF